MWQAAKPPATLSLSQGLGPYVMCFEKICLHLRYYHTTNQACLLKVEGGSQNTKNKREERRGGRGYGRRRPPKQTQSLSSRLKIPRSGRGGRKSPHPELFQNFTFDKYHYQKRQRGTRRMHGPFSRVSHRIWHYLNSTCQDSPIALRSLTFLPLFCPRSPQVSVFLSVKSHNGHTWLSPFPYLSPKLLPCPTSRLDFID